MESTMFAERSKMLLEGMRAECSYFTTGLKQTRRGEWPEQATRCGNSCCQVVRWSWLREEGKPTHLSTTFPVSLSALYPYFQRIFTICNGRINVISPSNRLPQVLWVHFLSPTPHWFSNPWCEPTSTLFFGAMAVSSP